MSRSLVRPRDLPLGRLAEKSRYNRLVAGAIRAKHDGHPPTQPQIERMLHRLLPRWYTPLYNLVSFTLIPYAEAVRRTRRAGRVVRLVAAGLSLLALAAASWVLR